MEKGDKIPKEATDAYVASENQDVQRGVSTQQGEEEPSAEANEEEVEEGETYSPSQRIKSLQTDLTDLVTNIQTAADAKESLQRKELEEARRSRLEQLENDMTFSLLKFEEIIRGWSVGEQMETPQELQEALDNQKELCATLIAEKKKLINELKKELKDRDDRYVKDLRKHGEEIDLMTERMEDQIETLMKAYREELAQIERVCQQQHKVLLTRGKTEWERLMKEFLDKELEGLTKRQKKVEEYEATIRNLILEPAYKNNVDELELNAKSQVVEREHQRLKSTRMIASLKQINQEEEVVKNRFNLAHMRSRTNSLQTEIKKLLSQCSSQEKQFKKKNHDLLEDYKRNIQQYQSLQSKIKHFAAADASKFEQMWLMAEAEVKQHVERALAIDSLICRRLGFSWERPSMAFMEHSGPIQAKKGAVQCNDRLTDASAGPKTQSTLGMVESSAELEQELSVERIMELLCDEVSLGFLVDDKPFNQLPPPEKTCSKLCTLLTTLGIEEKDLPKLSHFLIKHKHLVGEQTEYVCVESGDQMEEVQINSTAHPTAELIDSKDVVPALKSFLEHIMSSREKATLQHCSFPHIRDASEDQVYWESMGNIIPEEKLKLWDITGKVLKQYHMLLGEISEIIPETQSLEQQNKELQMLLQHTLSS